ncbi:hypothetical protein EGI22_17755 [Lacihabitans sp. LS3-19]|uniref:hypothetical protein n=1 Tax=Lacihabitans sp. LS3-19 TaxID=2487335 RepID=UPI0020CC00A1|nr:hypothetical protein [Lacihabitans sp. LS3-19]MCP9769753.1 hypothetical protein [Lacihabitans sp. LS3-19]
MYKEKVQLKFKKMKYKLEEIEEKQEGPNPKKLIVWIIIVLIFSLLSPILFTQFTSFIDFSKAANIGDSIAIMNPFITIISVILTFFAFKIQFDANIKQLQIFNTQLKNNEIIKKNKNFELQSENLDMLIFDLNEFIDDTNIKIKLINEFTKYNELEIFIFKPISRTSLFKLKNIFQNDRKLVYQYLKNLYKEENDNLEWIKNYSKLYATIGSIPDYFNDIYNRSDLFAEKINIFFKYFQNESRALYQNASIQFNNRNEMQNSIELKTVLNDFLSKYKKIVEKPSSLKNNNDIFLIHEIFSNLFIDLSTLDYELKLGLSEYLIRINNLIVEVNMKRNEISKFKENLKNEIKELYIGKKSHVKELERLKLWLIYSKTL